MNYWIGFVHYVLCNSICTFLKGNVKNDKLLQQLDKAKLKFSNFKSTPDFSQVNFFWGYDLFASEAN